MSEDQVPPASTPPPPPPPPSSGPGFSGSSGGTVSQNRTPMIVLAYLWILALIPLLVEKDDQEVQWHSKHGLVLTGAELAIWIVLNIVNSFIGCIGCVAFPVIFLGFLVFRIACIAKALKGERLTIPGLSEFADRF